MTNRGKAASLLVLSCAIAGCGQAPIKPAANHLRAEDAPAASAIPAPVQVTPVLPKPRASVRPETYSVVVNNVRVQELLFALARDARLQIDIDPNLTGTVTLNAIDQTLPQLLGRIARQVDMRYELDGDTLMVMRDSPFLRSYKIDYLSAARTVKMQSTASTQFGSSQAGGPTATGATSTIDVAAQNNLWESIVQNLKEILRETDKIIPAPSAAAAPAPQASTPSVPGATPQPPIPGSLPLPQPSATYQRRHVPVAKRPGQLAQQQPDSSGQHQPSAWINRCVAQQIPHACRAHQPDRRSHDKAAFLCPVDQDHQRESQDVDHGAHGHVRETRSR